MDVSFLNSHLLLWRFNGHINDLFLILLYSSTYGHIVYGSPLLLLFFFFFNRKTFSFARNMLGVCTTTICSPHHSPIIYYNIFIMRLHASRKCQLCDNLISIHNSDAFACAANLVRWMCAERARLQIDRLSFHSKTMAECFVRLNSFCCIRPIPTTANRIRFFTSYEWGGFPSKQTAKR